MHFAIYIYDTHPALEEPRPVSLCLDRESLQELLTDDAQEVTCSDCLGIMERLRLYPA